MTEEDMPIVLDISGNTNNAAFVAYNNLFQHSVLEALKNDSPYEQHNYFRDKELSELNAEILHIRSGISNITLLKFENENDLILFMLRWG